MFHPIENSSFHKSRQNLIVPISKALNPSKLYSTLLTMNNKDSQCQQTTTNNEQLKDKKQRVIHQISELQKRLEFAKNENKSIESVVKIRNDKIQELEMLSKQRDKIDVRLKKQCYKSYLLDSTIASNKSSKIFSPGQKSKGCVLRQKLSLNRSNNAQMKIKIHQIKQYIRKMQAQNTKLLQQKHRFDLLRACQGQNNPFNPYQSQSDDSKTVRFNQKTSNNVNGKSTVTNMSWVPSAATQINLQQNGNNNSRLSFKSPLKTGHTLSSTPRMHPAVQTPAPSTRSANYQNLNFPNNLANSPINSPINYRINSSDAWIERIERIKREYLGDYDQFKKLKILDGVRSIRQNRKRKNKAKKRRDQFYSSPSPPHRQKSTNKQRINNHANTQRAYAINPFDHQKSQLLLSPARQNFIVPAQRDQGQYTTELDHHQQQSHYEQNHVNRQKKSQTLNRLRSCQDLNNFQRKSNAFYSPPSNRSPGHSTQSNQQFYLNDNKSNIYVDRNSKSNHDSRLYAHPAVTQKSRLRLEKVANQNNRKSRQNINYSNNQIRHPEQPKLNQQLQSYYNYNTHSRDQNQSYQNRRVYEHPPSSLYSNSSNVAVNISVKQTNPNKRSSILKTTSLHTKDLNLINNDKQNNYSDNRNGNTDSEENREKCYSFKSEPQQRPQQSNNPGCRENQEVKAHQSNKVAAVPTVSFREQGHHQQKHQNKQISQKKNSYQHREFIDSAQYQCQDRQQSQHQRLQQHRLLRKSLSNSHIQLFPYSSNKGDDRSKSKDKYELFSSSSNCCQKLGGKFVYPPYQSIYTKRY